MGKQTRIYQSRCRCEPCGKWAYRSRSDARCVIRQRNQRVRALEIYPCPHGCGWHLTSSRTYSEQN